MISALTPQTNRFQWLTTRNIDSLPQLANMSADERLTLKAVAQVWPFRVNHYVLEELIDWDKIPDDPIYQLTMPQPGMLEPNDTHHLKVLLTSNVPRSELTRAVRNIQARMNPHPANQQAMNIPKQNGEPMEGIQHKYRETVLFFPSPGQTCHTYCTYCFRWAQFTGNRDLRFGAHDCEALVQYLKHHRDVTDVLITGGDPLVMKTKVLQRFLEPLLEPGLEHVTNIRIGTKSPAFWPARFLTDEDADDLLRLFEQVRKHGKHISIMAHFSHYRELETAKAQAALRRIIQTGAQVRCQAPLIRHVNDAPEIWQRMWQTQVKLGALPYYFFVERDTGPKRYFEIPLAEAFEIFTQAYRHVSGLARTVRGPSMSTTPGKVLIDGIEELAGEKVFVLKFIQARRPEWVNRVFLAKFDAQATWFTDLNPAFEQMLPFFVNH